MRYFNTTFINQTVNNPTNSYISIIKFATLDSKKYIKMSVPLNYQDRLVQ